MEQIEINSFINEMQNELEGKTVRHVFKSGLHQFIIEGGGRSYFIYLNPSYFKEEDAADILNELNKYQVFETINKSRDPIWLYLSASGLKKVDENFIRTKPA